MVCFINTFRATIFFLAREINACIFESAYLARLILSLDVTTQPNHHIIRKQTKIQRHKSLRKRSRPASTHAQIRQAWSCWELERNSKIAQHVRSHHPPKLLSSLRKRRKKNITRHPNCPTTHSSTLSLPIRTSQPGNTFRLPQWLACRCLPRARLRRPSAAHLSGRQRHVLLYCTPCFTELSPARH